MLFERWSAAGDEVEEPQPIIAANNAPASEPLPAAEEDEETAESGFEAIRRSLLGSPTGEAMALLGKPSLYVSGLGPFGADEKYVFPLEEGVAAVISVTDGVIVSVKERER